MRYSLLGQTGLVTVWSPLASGFLSGKYTRENLSDPNYRFSGLDILPFDKEHGFALVERLRALAAPRGASVAQVALAWLLAKPAVTSVILGASKLSKLEENPGAADLRLTDAEVAELDAATTLAPVYPNGSTNDGWTKRCSRPLRSRRGPREPGAAEPARTATYSRACLGPIAGRC